MKIISFLSFTLLVLTAGCKSVKPAAEVTSAPVKSEQVSDNNAPAKVDYSQQTTWLLGYFNLSQLTHEPHSAWYIKGYDDYAYNSEVVNKLLEIPIDDLTIKIVMGTWCPDSRREVPRFMRVMDLWKFPHEKITFIGVDNAKLSPVGEYAGLKIEWVPTFIVYKNNIEAGRIIENPVTSLEQDIINILKKNE